MAALEKISGALEDELRGGEDDEEARSETVRGGGVELGSGGAGELGAVKGGCEADVKGEEKGEDRVDDAPGKKSFVSIECNEDSGRDGDEQTKDMQSRSL